MWIVVVGDLCQLPPISKKFIFDTYKNDTYNLYHPWKVFKMIKLQKIMRQKNDQAFIELLSRIRIGKQTKDDIRIIQSRSIRPTDASQKKSMLLMKSTVHQPLFLSNLITQILVKS